MAEPSEAMAEVNPGKLTWMLASFGNERFEYLVSRGTGHDMARILHGFLISSDLEDGKRVFSPGIATSWEISADGLSWTLNLRDDVKFQDGTDLTAEDVVWSLLHNIGPQAPEYGSTQTLAKNMERIEKTDIELGADAEEKYGREYVGHRLCTVCNEIELIGSGKYQPRRKGPDYHRRSQLVR